MTDEAGAPGEYVVLEAGESWAKIGKALGVPVKELKAHNGFDVDAVLQPGDVIRTPEFDPVPRQVPVTVECGHPEAFKPGAKNSDIADGVRRLQTLLATDGWYSAAVDGLYGPLTQQGVQQMQKFLKRAGAYDGPIDGLYSEATRAALCAYSASL